MKYSKLDWRRDIRAAAKAAGCETQKELADETGYDFVTVNRWWNGKALPPEKRRDEILKTLEALRYKAPGITDPPRQLPPPVRVFRTEEQKQFYILGVLDHSALANGEVARGLTTARDALLAPIEAAQAIVTPATPAQALAAADLLAQTKKTRSRRPA